MFRKLFQGSRKVWQRVSGIVTTRGLKSFGYFSRYFKADYQGRRVNRKLETLLASSDVRLVERVQSLLIKSFPAQKAAQRENLYQLYYLLAQVIECIQKGQFSAEKHQALVCLIEEMDSASLGYKAWFALKFIAIANGLYEASYLFREHGIACILSIPREFRSGRDALLKRFAAEAEKSQWSDAEATLKLLEGLALPVAELNRMRIHLAIFRGNRELAAQLAQVNYRTFDNDFATFIRGKRVAVVGPAPGRGEVAEEIDQFDIVIRTNYRGKDKMPPASEFGVRTDVAYYNAANTRQIFDQASDPTFLNDLSFAVFKKDQDTEQAVKKLSDSRYRTLFSANAHLVTGKAQMIEHVLFDLLHFGPAQIKLFKINFLMTNKPYYQDYISPSNKVSQQSKLWLDHAYHDLITQVVFVRNLLANQAIDAEEETRLVLAHSDREYIQTIQRYYSFY